MTATSTSLRFGQRFCGPPGMANGGFACGSVAALLWAALDCPSGIAAAEAVDLPGGTAVLLGRMTANVAAPPWPGEECRVVAWPGPRDGRKLTAFSALLGPGGEVLASAVAVWLTVPRPAAAAPAAGPAAAPAAGPAASPAAGEAP